LAVDDATGSPTPHQGSDVHANANLHRLAGHYRFQPIAATPRHPQGKGKVENPFRHLEQRFLLGTDWRDFEHFEVELGAFQARWETRVHGTTKVPPVTRFAEERPALLPLPATPFFGWHEAFRQASKDRLISYGGVPCSVSWPYAN